MERTESIGKNRLLFFQRCTIKKKVRRQRGNGRESNSEDKKKPLHRRGREGGGRKKTQQGKASNPGPRDPTRPSVKKTKRQQSKEVPKSISALTKPPPCVKKKLMPGRRTGMGPRFRKPSRQD